MGGASKNRSLLPHASLWPTQKRERLFKLSSSERESGKNADVLLLSSFGSLACCCGSEGSIAGSWRFPREFALVMMVAEAWMIIQRSECERAG